MKAGDRIDVEVATLGREGDAVALHDGYEVRVSGLLPGERSRVVVEHVSRFAPDRPRRVHARCLEVLQPVPERTTPPCTDHESREGRCTGCPWMHVELAAQRDWKRRMLEADHGLAVSEVCGVESALGYRFSSKRVARTHGGRLHLGSYRRGSHQLADMDGCLVDHPDIAAAARAIAVAATRLGIVAWDERRRAGDLRYVWLKTDGRGAVLATLITGGQETRVRELAEALPELAGVAWSVQEDAGNAIRGADLAVLRGVSSLAVELAGIQVECGPLGFLQPNPRVAELAYADLCALPVPSLVFDLYAGAGVTTELLRRTGARVLACEAYPESAERLGAPPETAEAFLARALAEGLVPGLVVANPPRAGLGPEVCAALVTLASRGLSEVRIMSCGPAGLRADLERLSPGFDLVGLRAYDTLPHTPHVELVATLHATVGSR